MIVEMTYKARCKHCWFLKAKKFGNAKRHICTNKESERFDPNPYLSQVALKDEACENFKI